MEALALNLSPFISLLPPPSHAAGCSLHAAATSCISLDCPHFYQRCQALRTTQHMFAVLRHAGMLPSDAAAGAGSAVPAAPAVGARAARAVVDVDVEVIDLDSD